ncbi:methyltransferase domain-containing protein [Wenzhouxiangella sp. AB-CW3]|uniref:class I SAM-dependent methyltransferase n=1 Tax=Wenzhouxiangella sp. AB-CW3 TaxID=2771012 RepID=UPI00168ADB53|nr:methyltransferase domain-containing protein [Wenzhouxiangella sp. AB-CW3]QOC23939.1 methyltransferase domain-containing protein [Wenzhouxiangella sp. AB-CW3]
MLASRYEQRWHHYLQVSTERTLDQLGLASGQCLVDLGCGTGLMLARIEDSRSDARLTGVDLSADMLAVARDRLAPSTGLIQASIERLPLASRSADVLVSTSVFHFIRNPESALEEMSRVLRPGGQLVVTDWCRDFMSMRLLDAYLKAFRRPHHHTCTSEEFAALLTRHGFDSIRLSTGRIDWFWGLFTATARRPA